MARSIGRDAPTLGSVGYAAHLSALIILKLWLTYVNVVVLRLKDGMTGEETG